LTSGFALAAASVAFDRLKPTVTMRLQLALSRLLMFGV
jgi:hypothetical protein